MPVIEQETLATATTTDINLLIREFHDAGIGGDFWNRQQLIEDTRLARWDAQSDDGKKWDRNLPDGSKAFPWNGASDVRVFQADEIINEAVAVDGSAFWRSDVRVEGVEPGDIASASSCSRFMQWMRDNSMRQELQDEVELSSQYRFWYGWTVLHVTWERLVSYQWKSLDMDSLSQLAMQLSQQAETLPPELQEFAAQLMAFPSMVGNEEMDDLSADFIKVMYRAYVAQYLPSTMTDFDIPELSTSRAKKIVRDLRTSGKSQAPWPYVCKNKPSITALKPWRDIVVPSDTTDLQSARAIFVRQLISEADVRAMEQSDNWDHEFIEAAVQTKGRMSVWNYASANEVYDPLYKWSFTKQRNNLIEIVYAYHRAVDDDGLSAVYSTVFSPHITASDTSSEPLYARTGLLDHPDMDEYPVVAVRRELLDRQVMSSRGVPELTMTSQREEKTLRDSMMDWCSVGVSPPLNVYKGTMGQRYEFGPAVQNLVTSGREPKLMDIPSEGPRFAAEYLALLKQGVDRYFARHREDIPPEIAMMVMEPRVRRFLDGWGQALRMAFALYQHYAPETFERVTGQPMPQLINNKLDFIFHFDVAQLHPEMMEKKLLAFSNLLPEDSVGVINRPALIAAKARMIDPVLAEQLIMDQGAASQLLFDKVKSDLVAMSDGNDGSYIDAAKDNTAQSRKQYVQQIVSQNIKYMQRLDPAILQELGLQSPFNSGMGQGNAGMAGPMGGGEVDPIFSSLLEKYLKNLQLAIDQQQNKVIGRIGVAQ